jgi:hypothetical protein
MKATPFDQCDFTRDKKDRNCWVCAGSGNMLGEMTFGRGRTKHDAHENYLRVRAEELADILDDEASEAEIVQEECRDGLVSPEPSSMRDLAMMTADVDAMRDKARRLRGK